MLTEHGRVRVSRPVYEGLDAVRQSGLTNMFDRAAVRQIAAALGYHETAAWLDAHPRDYAAGVLHGFAPVDEGGAP